MNKILPIILVVVLSGCAGLTKTYLPSGDMGYEFTCVPAATNCSSIMGEECKGKGYEILREDKVDGVAGAPNTISFLFRCK